MTVGHLLSQGRRHGVKMLIRIMLEFLRQVGNADGCGGGLDWGGQDYSWGTFGHWEPGWFPLESGLLQMCLNIIESRGGHRSNGQSHDR